MRAKGQKSLLMRRYDVQNDVLNVRTHARTFYPDGGVTLHRTVILAGKIDRVTIGFTLTV